MLREPRPSRDQVTHDHVFLEAAQPINFTERGCLCKNASGVLERRSRNKAVRFKRSFRDAKQYGNGFRWFATFFDYFFVLLFEVELVHLIAPQ